MTALSDIIYKRKSIRKYQPDPLDEKTLQDIKTYLSNTKPLYEDIKVNFDITGKESVKGLSLIPSPHYIIALSENKPGYLVNVGFILQQLDLCLSSTGLGGCWVGMAQPKEKPTNNMEFVIAYAFGKPDENLHRQPTAFKRKPLNEISNTSDARLEPARLAPSAMNWQKYHFITTDDNTIHAYCTKAGTLTPKQLAKMRDIDIGIAIAHLYITNQEQFNFFKTTNPQEIKGHYYIGSIEI